MNKEYENKEELNELNLKLRITTKILVDAYKALQGKLPDKIKGIYKGIPHKIPLIELTETIMKTVKKGQLTLETQLYFLLDLDEEKTKLVTDLASLAQEYIRQSNSDSAHSMIQLACHYDNLGNQGSEAMNSEFLEQVCEEFRSA